MLDSHQGIHLMVVVQLRVIADPCWVYCPGPFAWVPETVWFWGLPGKVR